MIWGSVAVLIVAVVVGAGVGLIIDVLVQLFHRIGGGDHE